MKKLLCLLLVLLLLSFGVLAMTGCSSAGCAVASYFKLRDCLADCIEGYGDFADCTTCLFENCTDACYVAPCYQVGGCVRHCDPDACSALDNARKEFKRVPDGDYVLLKKIDAKYMSNLSDYYQVTVLFTVEAYTELKNVSIEFDISDVNGNEKKELSVYVANRIKTGKENAKTVGFTATFAYPEKGAISPSNANYGAYITNIRVYARE